MNNKDRDNNIFNVSRINFEGDFYAQLVNILKHIRLSREQVRELRFLYEDIENVLSVKWRGCKVHPFGSIVTGLGIKSSDADCYVDIPKPTHDIYNIKQTIFYIKYLLSRQPNKFQNCFAIPYAKVPIVKFTHVPLGIECDISCSGHLSVRNSQLIAFLLQSDPRILQMSLIIKYWSKVHGQTGTNLLSNYSLVLMIIFFLQIEGVLMSVRWLQQDKWSCREEYDNWNIGYMSNPHLLPITSNSTPLHKLLGQFFEYYSKFDYEHNVICPYLGQVIAKSAFTSEDSLPGSYELYLKNVFRLKKVPVLRTNTAICVQDPFIHNRNCSLAVGMRLMNQMKGYFTLARNLYDQCNIGNNYNSFLCDLLTRKPEGLIQYVPVNTPNKNVRAKMNRKKKMALRIETWKKKMNNIKNKQMK